MVVAANGGVVTCTKVRSPDGREFSFYSPEEFRLAIRRGGITAEWSVLQLTTGRWLQVTEHPVFRAQQDVYETVRRSNATEITATRGSECDHVSVIGTLEQDEAARRGGRSPIGGLRFHHRVSGSFSCRGRSPRW